MNLFPEHIASFLELLTVLPQEAFSHKIAVRPEKRRLFEKELVSSVEIALNLLAACVRFEELREQVLEAFASWLRLSKGIPASVLASHPLVIEALRALKTEQLLEPAVNVVSELIHFTASQSGGLSAHIPLIHVLVPHVMDMMEQLQDSSKDDEDIKAIARLFADMGDCYVELIASGTNESLIITRALLEVASHPEYDISSMTYNFWHHLQVHLTRSDSYSSLGSEALAEAEKNRRIQVFRPVFAHLVSLIITRVEYPENHLELSEEDLKDFKHNRFVASDVLIDASAVLGAEELLKIVFLKFIQAVPGCSKDGSGWRPVEAALFCMQPVAKSVPVQEGEMMPKVFSILPELPHQPELLHTVCSTIGAYSKSLNVLPSVLPSLVDILTRGMSSSPESAAAASVAFKYICEDCRGQLSGSLDGLFRIYHIAISGDGGFTLASDDAMQLVMALSAVISVLPVEHAKKAVELLCLPAFATLEKITQEPGPSFEQMLARHLTVHIDRLGCIFRNVNYPEVVAEAVHRIWPIFQIIFDRRAWDMRTMESLCRACKYAVRTSGRFMGVTIGAMLEKVQFLYPQHNQPCFLYLSSEVIKIFGSDPSCTTYLRSLIEALFGHTTKILSSIQEFTGRPDLADDCYLLASRCIRYCPDLFVPSAIFASLIDCAMVGATVQHRDACKSILTFLSDVFDLANSSSGRTHRAVIDNVVRSRGAMLTRILVACLAGALPASRLDEVSYVLVALTRAYGAEVQVWSAEAVSLIPAAALTEAERQRLLEALTGGNKVNTTESLDEISEVCRRNRMVMEMIQGALRPHDLTIS
ncbi:ARM repeat superfamily protein isoform X2 [Wolffia australiana]